jgi:hypothetical protein
MKKILLCLLLIASPAAAQTAPPEQQIQQLIGSLIMANANNQYQLAQAQAQIADLKKQLEDRRDDKDHPAK